jgi:hypothetical protein
VHATVDELFCDSGPNCIPALKDSKLPKYAGLAIACAACTMVLCGVSLLMHFVAGALSLLIKYASKNKHWAVHALACFIGITGGVCKRTDSMRTAHRRVTVGGLSVRCHASRRRVRAELHQHSRGDAEARARA